MIVMASAAYSTDLIVYRRKRFRTQNLTSSASEGKPPAIVDAKDSDKDACLSLTVKEKKSKKPRNQKITPSASSSNALTVSRGSSEPCRVLERPGWGTLRVGTSGYVYKDWKKVVYPEDASQKEWFGLYTRLFDTVEINNTFYKLPSADVMDGWRMQAPPGFCYALKFSRFGTHMKRLKDPDGPISLFLERAVRLGDALVGPILVQLPPHFNVNVERLKDFLERAPKQYRWTVELRDSRWFCDEVFSVLRMHNAALCLHDHKDIPSPHPKLLTADWVYLRFHGYDYRSCYEHEELQAYALWIKEHLNRGLDVYAYFNNDYHGHAAANALDLKELVSKSF